VPLNQRTAEADTFLPLGGGPDHKSPLFVAKGTSVGYSLYAMHRRTDIFGADAEEFRPERWEENLRPGWAYLPFNGGPRACLGREFPLFFGIWRKLLFLLNLCHRGKRWFWLILCF
jgi:hypothetical protein